MNCWMPRGTWAAARLADYGVGPELTTALLDEAAKLAGDVLAPLRRVGDEHPATCS